MGTDVTLSKNIITELRNFSYQINEVFWKGHQENKNQALARWILRQYQNVFRLVEVPNQLPPKINALLLNLQMQCAAISGEEVETWRRLQLMRQGLTKRDFPRAETVWLQYQPRRGLNFRANEYAGRKVVLVPYIVAPWNYNFYYRLGEVFAFMLKRKRIPSTLRHQFQEAVRNNISASPAISPHQKSDPDLMAIYQDLNAHFFRQQLPEIIIRWSKRASKRKLGHWDEFRREIVINPLLKMPEVPHYVLRSIVFHEMLHIALPPRVVNGRVMRHYKAFRTAEKQFPDFQRSQEWIRRHWEKHYLRYHKR